MSRVEASAEPEVVEPQGWSALRLLLLLLPLAVACGVRPDPRIADEFHERLQAPARGFRSVPCRERAAKVEALRELVWLGHDLRARIREFDTMPPPQLHARMMAAPLRGSAADVRCIVRDLHGADPKEQADFLDALPLIANLLVLEGRVLLSQGRLEDGWAHVLEALALHGGFRGFGLEQHLTLLDVLRAIPPLLDAHPPDPATLERLSAAVDATRLDAATICGATRHDLLTLAVTGLRVHFGQREREAMAKRFGLAHAMRTWKSPWPGQLGRGEWMALRGAYDAIVDGCAKRPLGHALQRAAASMLQLDSWHPPTAVRLRMIADRLNRVGVLTDTQITVLASLRARWLRATQGRDPTTAELALSFGRRPRNPWDGRHYTFVVVDGVLTVVRGPYRHEVVLPPA